MKVRYRREAFDALTELRRVTRFGLLMDFELSHLESRLRFGDFRRGRKQQDGTYLATFEAVAVTFATSQDDPDVVLVLDVQPGALGGLRG